VLYALVASAFTFVASLGGALFGLWLRARLPREHLADESKETIRLAMGLIATMTALVLGLVIASAKRSFDEQDSAVKRCAADLLALDRVLARYGSETLDIRVSIRELVVRRVDRTWPPDGSERVDVETGEETPALDAVMDRIESLPARSQLQHSLQSQGLALGGELLQTRWLTFSSAGDSVPPLFLVILVCWLALIFASFGLLAPRNATVVAALAVAALSVSAAILVILEMDRPFDGLIRVPPGPLRYALAHLGR
jgi:hypothetical protein